MSARAFPGGRVDWNRAGTIAITKGGTNKLTTRGSRVDRFEGVRWENVATGTTGKKTSRSAGDYGVGGTLLNACLGAANMPRESAPATPLAARAASPPPPDSLAIDVRSQAARLHTLMAQAPAPDPNPRNPFSFGSAPRASHVPPAPVLAAAAEPAPPIPPPLPALLLMGVAEETTATGPRRTAVIGGDGDTIYMVREGDAVCDRYRVTKIGADAVELEDVVSKAYRRLALR